MLSTLWRSQVTLKITKIGNIQYKETDDEKVWIHLMLVNHRATVYATVAPNMQTAHALASMFGEVWETIPLQEVFDALKNAEIADVLDGGSIEVDSSSTKM